MLINPKHTFPKEERLTNKKLIDTLFSEGKSFNFPPLRFLYLKTDTPDTIPIQVLITVPKKNFPKAVDRNRLKRQIREGYRLNKHILYNLLKVKNVTLAIGIVYAGKAKAPFNEIESKIILFLEQLKATFEKDN